MTPEIEDAITRAAREQGIDPSFALAVAQRESNGNPNAKASRTIYGLFQMSGPLRARYGSGDSQDPYTQAAGWAKFAGDLKTEMADRLGRDPTNEELYLGHFFGGPRAARLISGQVPPSADVRDVFTPQELQANPEFARAGTVGNLMASVEGDIGKRIGSFGGNGQEMKAGPDFAAFGQAADKTGLTYKSTSAQPVDFAALGAAMTETAPAGNSGSAAQAPSAQAGPDEETAPAAAPQLTPATVAMRNAIAPPAPIAGIPAIPGQQPAMPQGGTAV